MRPSRVAIHVNYSCTFTSITRFRYILARFSQGTKNCSHHQNSETYQVPKLSSSLTSPFPQGPQRDDGAVLRPDEPLDDLDGGEPHRRRPPPQQQRRPPPARHQGGEGRLQAAARPALEQGQPASEIVYADLAIWTTGRSIRLFLRLTRKNISAVPIRKEVSIKWEHRNIFLINLRNNLMLRPVQKSS